jgi:hypothetical protein
MPPRKTHLICYHPTQYRVLHSEPLPPHYRLTQRKLHQKFDALPPNTVILRLTDTTPAKVISAYKRVHTAIQTQHFSAPCSVAHALKVLEGPSD